MKCIFCGEEFTVEGIKSTCGACGENKACSKYAAPPATRIIRAMLKYWC